MRVEIDITEDGYGHDEQDYPEDFDVGDDGHIIIALGDAATLRLTYEQFRVLYETLERWYTKTPEADRRCQ